MSVGAVAAMSGAAVGLGVACGIAAFRSQPTHTRARVKRLDLASLQGKSRKVAICAGCGVAAGLVTGWPVAALAGGVAAWWLPGLLGPDRSTACEVARIEAVAVFTEMLRDTLSAASGIEQAIRSACNGAPAEIAPQARNLARRIENQEELTGALAAFADELQDPTADIVVVSLVHAIRHSARDLASLLGSLATTARAHAAQRKRTQAARAQVRTSVRIVTAVTAGMLVGLFVLDRTFLTPYNTPLGQVVLAGGLAFFAVGYAWLWKMTHPRRRSLPLPRMDQVQEAQTWW